MGSLDAPVGWVLQRQSTVPGTGFLLPARVVEAIKADLLAATLRKVAEESAEKTKAAADKQATEEIFSKEAENWAARDKHKAHRHEIRRFPVFSDVGLVEARLQSLQDGLFGDKETASREVKALQSALQWGPFRSVARRSDWREALEDLTAELPAFRSAIDIIARAFEASEATGAPPVVPPILLVGPPGVGKSHFCRRLQETLDCGRGWLGLDQPTAGCDLRGTDKHWSNARHGLLFDLLGLGETSNPLVVLDEIDKACRSYTSRGIDGLAQLYAALEPETAKHLSDVSLDLELDASLVMYIATANSLKIDAAMLSRFSVIEVGLAEPAERREATRRLALLTFVRMGLRDRLTLSGGAIAILAEYSARVAVRALESAAGAALKCGASRIGADEIEVALGLAPPPLHDQVLH